MPLTKTAKRNVYIRFTFGVLFELKVFEKTSVLDISGLPDGSYLLKIENMQGFECLRFIKN
jgi:hypothetical protein